MFLDRVSSVESKPIEGDQIVYRKTSGNTEPDQEELASQSTLTGSIASGVSSVSRNTSFNRDKLLTEIDENEILNVKSDITSQNANTEPLYILGPYRMKSTINEKGERQLFNIDFNENLISSDVRLSKSPPRNTTYSIVNNNNNNNIGERTCYVVGKTKTKNRKDIRPLTFKKQSKPRSKSSESPESPGITSIEFFENYTRSTTPSSVKSDSDVITKKDSKKKSKGVKKASSFKELLSPLIKKRFLYNNNKNKSFDKDTKKVWSLERTDRENDDSYNLGGEEARQHIRNHSTNSRQSGSTYSSINDSENDGDFDEEEELSCSFNDSVNIDSVETYQPKIDTQHISSPQTQSDCSFSDSDDMEANIEQQSAVKFRKSRQKHYSKKHVNFADQNRMRTASPGSSVDSQYGGSTSSLSTVSCQSSFSTTTISALPDTLLLKIFQYLTTRDICRLSRVCRRWNVLHLAEPLWEKIEITNSASLYIGTTMKYILQRLAYTASCLSVRQIKLDGCLKLTDDSLKTIALRCPELRSIEIASCVEVTPKGIIDVLINCPNLLYLNVSRCENLFNFSNYSTDITLSIIFSELRYLDLSFCSSLTDEDLRYLIARTPSLEYLYLRQCDCISSVGIETIATLCPNLKEISLNDCVNVTDHGVVKLLSRCRALRYISLAKCPITNTALEQIANNPATNGDTYLRHLNLNECEYITDTAIMKISASCPRLRSLDIGKCIRLTDASLYGLSRCVLLRRLNLKSCNKITDAGVRKLATTCGSLRNLDVRGCSLSPETFEYVRIHCPVCLIDQSNITQF